MQRRRPLKLWMMAFCCGGQERFGTIGVEETAADFQCVTSRFSSVARTKLPARLLSRLSPSNLVSKAYEFQKLMSKSANPLRWVVNRFSGDLHLRHGVPHRDHR